MSNSASEGTYLLGRYDMANEKRLAFCSQVSISNELSRSQGPPPIIVPQTFRTHRFTLSPTCAESLPP